MQNNKYKYKYKYKNEFGGDKPKEE